MTPAVLLAALAGGAAVLALADALDAVLTDRAGGAGRSATARAVLAPVRRAGRGGAPPTVLERRRLAVVAMAVLLAGGWLLAGPLAGVAVAAGGPWIVLGTLRARRRRFRAELEQGAPVVARALADALAGGHSIRGALAEAGRGGVPGAAGSELSAASAALGLGKPTDEVLERLRRRAGARAFDTIVAAILLQREAGGDLAGLLRDVARTLEDAARLEQDAKAATAQARFTGLVVTALPAAAAVLAELASPGYLGGLLRSPLTAWLAGCALILQVAALVLIQRLARIRA